MSKTTPDDLRNTVGTQVNRSTAENLDAGMNIGKPVSASDGDNDVLVYTLSGDITIDGDPVAATTLFSLVASSGQLKTKAKLNFEGVEGTVNPDEQRVRRDGDGDGPVRRCHSSSL